MTVFEILSFHQELLRRLYDAGINTRDYQYVDLFRDYTRMVEERNKITYIVAVLSEKYAISERKVYGILRHLRTDCKKHAG